MSNICKVWLLITGEKYESQRVRSAHKTKSGAAEAAKNLAQQHNDHTIEFFGEDKLDDEELYKEEVGYGWKCGSSYIVIEEHELLQ